MDTNDGYSDQMPQIIGRYQVQESIGFGAMGAVYKAFDPLIKRTLAIKTIRLDIPRQSPQYKSFIDRFYHEARISGTLSHPNIVTLFDIGEENGLPYLAMEYVEGETIAGILEKGERFKPEKVISLVSQIASAVDYAHNKGVIHRDIKPSNLILNEEEKVKVTDFGIAKLIDAEMTQSGTLLGTPSYMSPEQAMGEKLDGRSDIFSLGVCAFEMLSGEQPFPGNNVTSILYKLVHVDPIEPANLEMNGLVPDKWHQVFGKVLAKSPDDRYQTATEFVQDLEYCLGAWFGAAVGDVAVPAGAPPELASGEEPTRAFSVLDEAAESATVGMPAMPAGARAADTLPPTPLGALLPATEGAEGTVVMEASAPAAAEEGTVLMSAPGAEPAPPAEGTVLMSALPSAPSEEGTVLMSALAAAAPAESAEEGTVVMVSPGPAAEGTVLMSVSPPAPAAEEGTVLMSSPVPPAEGTVLMSMPPPATPGAAEGTVLMSAAGLPAPPPAEGTVLMGAPAPLPTTGPLPRPRQVQAPLKKSASSLLMLLGGGALVLGVGLLVGLVFYLRQPTAVTPTPPVPVSTATPTPEPTAAPSVVSSGSLRVESTPPGATLSVDGEAKGTTPVDVTDLALGSHVVKLEMKGYQAATQTVELSAQVPQASISLTLERTAALTGSLEVASIPSGAAVALNGASAGQTPYRNRALRPGTYRVQVTREGYEPWVSDATVQAGKRFKLDAQLKAVAKATPTPEPRDVADPNKVYAPGEVDTLPRRVAGTTASYPGDAPRMKSGEQVSVAVSFTVTETGDVTDIKVVESGGRLVDEAVVASTRTWKYTPGSKKGVKVKVKMSSKQTFRAG